MVILDTVIMLNLFQHLRPLSLHPHPLREREGVRGFTLIELLVVIAILGILAVAVVTALNIVGNLNKGTLARSKTFNASIENALSINQVGKWSFEDGVGSTIAKDTSGYGNNGTLTNSPTWKTATDCGLGLGGCLSFDGVDDDFVDIPYNATLLPSSITLTAWAKANTLASWGGIVTNKNDGNHGINLQMGTNEDIASLVGSGDNSFYVKTDWKPKTGQWYHIVITHDSTNNENKLYVNGKLEKTYPYALLYNPNPPTRIGRFYTGITVQPFTFDGLIDEVAIYNQALLSSQIQKLYAQGVIRRAIAYR